MRKVRKLLPLIIALAMVLTMSQLAFADGSGSITVKNTTKDKEYAAYKVFDATYSGNSVAYSYTKETDDPLFNALQGADSPFTLTTTKVSNKYNVSLKDDMDAAKIADFFKKNEDKLSLIKKETATSTTLTFDKLAYGYYYITSSLGAAVTIDTAKPHADVIDKNQKPGWDPEDPDSPDDGSQDGKNVSSDTGNDKKYSKSNTSTIGDTVYFKINAYAPLFNKDKLITEYTFTDKLDSAFTFNDDMEIYAGTNKLEKDKDYTLAKTGDSVLTIKIKVDANENAELTYKWAVDTHLVITYSANLDKDATHVNENTIDMTWKQVTPDPQDPTKPKVPGNPDEPDNNPQDPPEEDQPPTVTTKTYSYGLELEKIDGKTRTQLTGAEFKLYDSETGGVQIKLVEDGDNYRVADSTQVSADATVQVGKAKIFGLKKGTYYLEEIKAPDGYNLLTSRAAFTVGGDGTTVNEDAPEYISLQLENNAGTILPETGGIGTVIFYVIGGSLMIAAAFLLVQKKKTSRK